MSEPDLRIHISRALHLYSRHLLREGLPVPTGLQEFAKSLALEVLAERPQTDPKAFALQEQRPVMLTVDQAAELLQVSTRTVERMVRAGQLRTTKIRGARRVAREEVRRLARGEDGQQRGA